MGAGLLPSRPSTAPPRPIPDVLRGPSQPLAAPLKEEMEARLGADLSDVRTHTDAAARASAAEIGARAYTSGSHVVVGDGGADKHTLAHELTHVIQQRSGPVAGTWTSAGLRLSDPSDCFERRADANASRVMAMTPAPLVAPGDVHSSAQSHPPASTASAVPAVQRHLGAEKLTKPHPASSHASPDDQREHDRQAQADFDEMTSEQLLAHFVGPSSKAKAPVDLQLEVLPPKLQALIRFIRLTITELEQALATEVDKPNRGMVENRFRARIRTAARSWHDDDKGKIPRPPKKDSSPRADFFRAWRNQDADVGKDVPTKQAKKGFTGEKLPYREFTATGWKEGFQKGRIIYDPIGDQIYLSLFHYDDVQYFRIVGPPRPTVSERLESSKTALSEWDIDLLLYQAWEDLSVELAGLAASAGGGKKAPTDGPAAALSEDARSYLGELHRLRELYTGALNAARDALAAKKAEYKKRAATAAKLAPKTNKKSKQPSATDEEPKFEEEFSSFEWLKAKFWVGSTDGYIGYREGKKIVCPAYDGSKIGTVADLFRECVDHGKVNADQATALMLAALVAEPSRHPAAIVEALFSVIHNSPFKKETRAFGTVLPMAAGGTIATGGVSIEVLLQEAVLSRQVLNNLLGKVLSLKPDAIQTRLIAAVEELGPAGFVAQVKDWLFLGLTGYEHQVKTLSGTPSSETSSEELEHEVESTGLGSETFSEQTGASQTGKQAKKGSSDAKQSDESADEASSARSDKEKEPLNLEMAAFLEALAQVPRDPQAHEVFPDYELLYAEPDDAAEERKQEKSPSKKFTYQQQKMRYQASAFVLVPNPGGGDCLFHALQGDTLDPGPLLALRKQVAAIRRGMPASDAANANNIAVAILQARPDLASLLRGLHTVPNNVYALMQEVPGIFAGDDEIVQWCKLRSAKKRPQQVVVADADGSLSVYSAGGRRQIAVTPGDMLAKAQHWVIKIGIGLYKTRDHYQRIIGFK